MCGIFGVIGPGLEAARLTYLGLWALQHRGQEGSGIISTDGADFYVCRGEGLVAHVYEEQDLVKLKGEAALGHNRYSTSGPSTLDHVQPIVTRDRLLTLVHNGNLPTTDKLEHFLQSKGIATQGHNDSELMHRIVTYYLVKGNSLEQAVRKSFPLFTGAFSLILLTKDTMLAVRDAMGIRPLAAGRIGNGMAFASETCALDIIKATDIFEVKPGQMIVTTLKGGVKKVQLAPGKEKLDMFEFVYFARPDSLLLGKRVNEVRRRMGEQLAREHVIQADVVIPVPDSAIPAAIGYAAASGVPYDNGLIKNRYIHRTFIQPAQKLRDQGVELKFNLISEIVKGKRVIVVDDSLVRGTTSKKLMKLIRQAGAKEIHFLSSSPAVKYPDFYGIDTPKQADLIGATMNEQEIATYIGADSMGYLSYEGMIAATGMSESQFCTSCFTGVYPVDIGKRITELKVV